MDYGDYYWGFYRDYYYRDPFPHSLLSTRELKEPKALRVPFKGSFKDSLKGSFKVLLELRTPSRAPFKDSNKDPCKGPGALGLWGFRACGISFGGLRA